MNSTPATASAPLTGEREEILQKAFEITKKKAIEEAARKEVQVKDIKEIQNRKLKELLMGNAKGGDGATETGLTSKDLIVEGERKIEKDAQEREATIDAAPDAYVFKRTDATAGVQHDDTREIGLADTVLLNPELAERVSKHEAEHREQDAGNQVLELPPTGNPVIDKTRKIERLALREKLSIDKEGGLNGHTPEYAGYVATAEATAEVLNQGGYNGEKMVEDAGRKVEGFQKLQEAMILSVVKKQLAENGKVEVSQN